MDELTPREIVSELDKYIVGQHDAKRAVAIALRNRYRRRLLPEDLQEEVMPKNILMIGPTGVGKTEIARRLARLAGAPFIKIEATKFTEVGYIGRDVEGIIRDLVETSMRMVKAEEMERVSDQAGKMAEERILDRLAPWPGKKRAANPFATIFNMGGSEQEDDDEERQQDVRERRRALQEQLQRGALEDREIEIEVEDTSPSMLEIFSGAGTEEMGINLHDVFGGMIPKKRKKRRVKISEAREILRGEEAQKLIDMDKAAGIAVERAEQSGIVFLDEIDKIAVSEGRGKGGPDVSREGVQRDILPIVEGSTVMTKYGPVNTDHILFIAAGAFHMSKPSDLIPELQGRFPIRVELSSLNEEDFRRILTEPRNALIKQYTALLATEGLAVDFTEDGVAAIARIAVQVNNETENIGARRLHTVMEKLLEEISFGAADLKGETITIDAGYVQEQLRDISEDRDLSRYIL